MSDYLNRLKNLLWRVWIGLSGRNKIAVHPDLNVGPEPSPTLSVLLETATAGQCSNELEAATARPLETIETIARHPSARRRFKALPLAARLLTVAKVKNRKSRRKTKLVGKAASNLRPKRVVASVKSAKRAPALFPTKLKPKVARKPTLRVHVAPAIKKTAEIVKFPVRKPSTVAHRHKRAA